MTDQTTANTDTTNQATSATANQATTAAATTTSPTTTGAAGVATAATPGTLSTTPGQLPGTTLTPAQMKAITDQNASNVTNPTLPQGATASPVNQTAQSDEMMNYTNLNSSADQVNANQSISASTVAGAATAGNPSTGLTAATYQAAQVDPQALANATQAVTAALPADALVSNQLQSLLTPDANGNLPAWIQPAITAANQLLSGRGISNSTMAGQAITSAILTAAIPIATSNANAELTAFTQNLSNQQQAALQQGQEFTQAALSNQGATNAALNFNATSENQTNQFMGSLAAQINQFNAAQVNSINQFNSTQTQSAATATAQLQSQLQEFNANMANQREQFNAQNGLIVQQSNAEYLRSVNTANTAVANQDNQLNAQNAMNLSDQSMANLQQQFNDESTMIYNSNMTAEQQNYSIAYLSQQFGLQNQLDQNVTDMLENVQLNQAIGTLAGNLFSPIVGAAGQAIGAGVSSLFTGGTSNVTAGNTPATQLDPGGTNSGGVGGATNPLDTTTSGDLGAGGAGDQGTDSSSDFLSDFE